MNLDGFLKLNGFYESLFDGSPRIPELRPSAEPRPLSLKSPEDDFCLVNLGLLTVGSLSMSESNSTMDLFFSIKNEDCFLSVGLALLLEALTFGDVLDEI